MNFKSTCRDASLAVVLGSGLNKVAQGKAVASIPYSKIPGLNMPSVPGHEPILDVVKLKEKKVLVFRGRIHGYERKGQGSETAIARFVNGCGIKKILFTHAVGSLNRSFKIGDIVLVRDHINLTGENPFITGSLDIKKYSPFQNVKRIYKNDLNKNLRDTLNSLKVNHKYGVYAGVKGPLFETEAEARMFEIMGADVAGMSLVQEALTSFFLGMEVASLAYVTNSAFSSEENLHEKVLNRSRNIVPKLEKIISHLTAKI